MINQQNDELLKQIVQSFGELDEERLRESVFNFLKSNFSIKMIGYGSELYVEKAP